MKYYKFSSDGPWGWICACMALVTFWACFAVDPIWLRSVALIVCVGRLETLDSGGFTILTILRYDSFTVEYSSCKTFFKIAEEERLDAKEGMIALWPTAYNTNYNIFIIIYICRSKIFIISVNATNLITYYRCSKLLRFSFIHIKARGCYLTMIYGSASLGASLTTCSWCTPFNSCHFGW